jgi:hypothetical protein
VEDLREQSVQQGILTQEIIAQQEKVQAKIKQMASDDALTKSNKLELESKYTHELFELQIQEGDSRNKQAIIYRQIEQQKQNDQEEAHKKSIADWDKYVSDTIGRAKKIESAFKNIIDISPDFSVLDTKAEELKKAEDFLNKFDARNFKFKALVQPDFKAVPPEATSVKRTNEEIKKILAGLNDRPIEDQVFVFVDPKIIHDTEAMKAKLKELEDQLKETTQQAFAGGIEGLAESIGEALAGQNIGKKIADVMGGLISQIGKALVQYGIVKEGLDKILVGGLKIPGALAIGLGLSAIAIGALVKSAGQRAPGLAQGGVVTSATLAQVGEGYGTSLINPEVISPLSSLKGMIGDLFDSKSFGRGAGSSVTAPLLSLKIPKEVKLYADGRSVFGTMVLEGQRQQNNF